MSWSEIGEDERDGLNVALNEATWWAARCDQAAGQVELLLQVLTLPETGVAGTETMVLVTLGQVRRVAASLRHGRWDDASAPVETFTIDDLDRVVRSFGGCPIHGWEFIDPPEQFWAPWRDRLSLDLTVPGPDAGHVLDLFQASGAGQPRHLDMRVWFNRIHIRTVDGHEIPLPEFITGGVRWWDGLYAGDTRTEGKGLIPG